MSVNEAATRRLTEIRRATYDVRRFIDRRTRVFERHNGRPTLPHAERNADLELKAACLRLADLLTPYTEKSPE